MNKKQKQQGNLDWLRGNKEIIHVIQSINWHKTGIGPIELWPQNFKSLLNLCLEAQYPIAIYWGPKFVLFYNESWKPIVGNKHPQSFGQGGAEVWSEIWEVLGPMLGSILETGEVILKSDQLFLLERFGYVEECYFNFSLSPIRTAEGKVEGIFNVAIETTYRVLNERRTELLQYLASQTLATKSVQETCTVTGKIISENSIDIPFSLLYLTDKEEKEIVLMASSGIYLPHPLVPQHFLLSEQSNKTEEWKIADTVKTGLAHKLSVTSVWSHIIKDGHWPEKPKEAWSFPIPAIGHKGIAGVLVVGISPQRAFDTNYQTFFNIICSNIASAIHNARTHEEERNRTEALAEIDRVKTAFFSNVSHEFRTPLTLMLGPIEELLNNNQEDLQPHHITQIEIVHRNSLRLLKLVNTLLDFSRIEANRAEAIYEPIELTSFTIDLASSFRSAVEKAGMKYTIDCSPLPEIAYVDKDMWEKIVLNLISNAFKYTLQGEIKVSLKASASAAVLTVSDTGIGIPEHELPKIFQRFHRVQGAKGRTHEGTGIGLSLVQELVKLQGGTVTVESTLDKGSTFTVNIPLGSKHIPQDRLSNTQKVLSSTAIHTEAYLEEALRWNQTPQPSKETATQKLRHPSGAKEPSLIPEENNEKLQKKKIVLADDNADMRDYIFKLLTNRYNVTVTANGKEALDAIYKIKPDLLLSDVMMPVMDGFELLKILRDDPNYQTIPIILLSARAGEESKTSGIGLGADDYLTKPFSAKELQVRVQTQINLSEMRTKLLHALELSNKELDIFSSAVSHDLRAPLRSMAGFSKILFDEYSEVIDSRGKSYLQRIMNSTHKMGLLIDGLLNLSRLSRGQMNNQMIDISKIVQSITEELQSIDPSRKVDFIIEKNVTLVGDSQLYYIALQNLLNNAWKFTSKKERGIIEFGVEIQNGKKTYFIKDNGAGFDMEFSDKLFGIFERLHSAKDFEGTGIGLATVQRIIQRHGGHIWAEGVVNQGAVFYFNFLR